VEAGRNNRTIFFSFYYRRRRLNQPPLLPVVFKIKQRKEDSLGSCLLKNRNYNKQKHEKY